ncbi:hypothetical protein [Brevibacterium samyangense]|uniref:Uncharacterized protein n=1 Tax=Brevibacterium samyangense TaxID=366888 RepID=A0ABN2TJ32_9MICO
MTTPLVHESGWRRQSNRRRGNNLETAVAQLVPGSFGVAVLNGETVHHILTIAQATRLANKLIDAAEAAEQRISA